MSVNVTSKIPAGSVAKTNDSLKDGTWSCEGEFNMDGIKAGINVQSKVDHGKAPAESEGNFKGPVNIQVTDGLKDGSIGDGGPDGKDRESY